jgi:hypothetical protein
MFYGYGHTRYNQGDYISYIWRIHKGPVYVPVHSDR